jgi:hypothetical protein
MFIRSIFNAATELARDMRFAVRSLLRAKGLATTVVITLGLGIGANAAIFSIVRGVLLRPLVNRDEERLIYIRQTAPGIGIENYTTRSRCRKSETSSSARPRSAPSAIFRPSTWR